MSNPLNTPVQEQVKAVTGSVLAGLTALGTALADSHLSSVEIVGIAIAVLATYSAVFGVTNSDPSDGDEADEATPAEPGREDFAN